MDFHAVYMTGYGTTASYLGLPDAGLSTYTDMVGRAGMIAGLCKTPLIADADTGYGGLLNVQPPVRGYEAAGVQAIQIEDQERTKKCGHTPERGEESRVGKECVRQCRSWWSPFQKKKK